MSYIIFIVYVDKNNDLCKSKPQSPFVVVHGLKILQNEMESIQKQPSSIKRCNLQRACVQKSYEIKDGDHEMTAMMLSTAILIIALLSALHPFHGYHI